MDKTEIETSDKNATVVPVRQHIDIFDIISMRMKNKLSYREIEKLTGIDHSTIHKKYKDVIELFDPEKINRYESTKDKMLSGVERILLQDIIDPNKRDKASLNNAAYAFNIVYTANRLERGKSTDNISVLSQIASRADTKEIDIIADNDNI